MAQHQINISSHVLQPLGNAYMLNVPFRMECQYSGQMVLHPRNGISSLLELPGSNYKVSKQNDH